MLKLHNYQPQWGGRDMVQVEISCKKWVSIIWEKLNKIWSKEKKYSYKSTKEEIMLDQCSGSYRAKLECKPKAKSLKPKSNDFEEKNKQAKIWSFMKNVETCE